VAGCRVRDVRDVRGGGYELQQIKKIGKKKDYLIQEVVKVVTRGGCPLAEGTYALTGVAPRRIARRATARRTTLSRALGG